MYSFTDFSSLQRTTRSHTFITAEVSATFMDDMTGRFGIGTMHAVFQVVGTVFVEKQTMLLQFDGVNDQKNAIEDVDRLVLSCLLTSYCRGDR